MLDIARLRADLEAFARHVETDSSVDAATVVSTAQVLLARIGDCAPAASDREEHGTWEAMTVAAESGERRITCWCERPGGQASIDGVLGSAGNPPSNLTVQIGERVWMKQGAMLMQSDIRPDAAVDPQDEAFFAELKQYGVRLLHTTVRVDSAPVEGGRLEPLFGGGGAYEGLPPGRDPYASVTRMSGLLPDLEERAAPRDGPETLRAKPAADWRCEACGKVNPTEAKFCMNCAAPASRS